MAMLLIKKWRISDDYPKVEKFLSENRFSRILLILEKYRISHFCSIFSREMKFFELLQSNADQKCDKLCRRKLKFVF